MYIEHLIYNLGIVCGSFPQLSEKEKIYILGVVMAALENMVSVCDTKIKNTLFKHMNKLNIEYLKEKKEIE